jgi:hypothetical protein
MTVFVRVAVSVIVELLLRCGRRSASAACVAERNDGAAASGLRGRGTQ